MKQLLLKAHLFFRASVSRLRAEIGFWEVVGLFSLAAITHGIYLIHPPSAWIFAGLVGSALALIRG